MCVITHNVMFDINVILLHFDWLIAHANHSTHRSVMEGKAMHLNSADPPFKITFFFIVQTNAMSKPIQVIVRLHCSRD